MTRTLAIETIQKIAQEIKLQGWVNTIRSHGKITFIDLRDRSGVVQMVVGGDKSEKLNNIGNEDVIEVIGLVKQRPEKMVNPNIKTGTVEIEVKEIKVLAKSTELPFDMGGEKLNVSLPTLLDYRSLSLRHPKNQAIFKVQETIISGFRESLKKQGFTEIQVPTIVPTATEGGAEVFKIKYFKNEAYLAQSPQLYKQVMVGVFERVFTLAHAYRAEPSITTRHMTEYLGLDAEMGFIESFEDIMDMVETLIRDIFKKVEQDNQGELRLFSASLPKLANKIPRMKMREAQEIIFQRTGRDNRQEPDLEPEDEREICRYATEKYKSELIFITHYPTRKRPFYTYPDEKDPEFTNSFDLLGRGLEWVTGGRRINDYQMLLNHVKKWGNKPEDFDIYLQAFKYGMPPEGGFCLGAERMTAQILGLENIRQASLFPRDMERIDIKLTTVSKSAKPAVSLFKKIISILDKEKITYKLYEHEAVFTSVDAAKARGTKVHQGAKALVMYADGKPVMLVLPADLKIDTNKFKHDYKIRDLRLATADEVEKLTQTQIGAVPPFGNLFDMPLYMDGKLRENQEIVFNAGLHTNSIKMKEADFEKITHPIVGDFSKTQPQ